MGALGAGEVRTAGAARTVIPLPTNSASILLLVTASVTYRASLAIRDALAVKGVIESTCRAGDDWLAFLAIAAFRAWH